MSKVKNGNYGTFASAGVRAAVKEYCDSRGKSQEAFFTEDVKLHNRKWWGLVCNRSFIDETELKSICREIGYDFKKTKFRAGEVNDKVIKDREASLEKFNTQKSETKAVKREVTPVQMEITDFIQGTPSQDKKILEIWREVQRLGYEKSMAVAEMAKAARSLGLL